MRVICIPATSAHQFKGYYQLEDKAEGGIEHCSVALWRPRDNGYLMGLNSRAFT